MSLEELLISTAQVEEKKTGKTIGCLLHKFGLYESVIQLLVNSIPNRFKVTRDLNHDIIWSTCKSLRVAEKEQ